MKHDNPQNRTMTMVFNSVSLFLTALRAYHRSVDEGFPHDNALISIIFAAASVEAMVNELLEASDSILDTGTYSNPTVRAFVDLQCELEEARGSVKSKVIMTKWVLSGKPLDKGSSLYQDFVALMDLRNELVHMKGMSCNLPFGHQAKFREPKAFAHLRSKHLLEHIDEEEKAGWTNEIRNEKCARWACETAAHIATELARELPVDNDFFVQLRGMFEEEFLNNPLLTGPPKKFDKSGS